MNTSLPMEPDSERPLLIVEHGQVLHERIDGARVAVQDILMAARKAFGIERLDQIRHALLEADGRISIVPCEAPVEQDSPAPFPPTEQMR